MRVPVYIAAQAIITEISQRTGAPLELIRSHRRHHRLTLIRAACVRSLRAAGYSWPEIGRALGGRHHTTAMWLARKAERTE
jgi:chromosomal replication initiation ATPase DnaA